MKVDYALILSAGVGSRMGEIGKDLPKPLWPIFDKRLIDLQIAYTKNFDIKNIYINVHHQAELIKGYLEDNYPEVKVLHEEELLGIGGAIHNLAQQKEVNYKGTLFVINSDQFLMISKKQINKDIQLINESPALLYTIEVENNDIYGAVKTENSRLIELIPNKVLPRDRMSITYTGNSLINLSKLNPSEGASHFFDTIANYKIHVIKTNQINDKAYWDFGTIPRYFKSLYKTMALTENDPFFQFLIENHAINPEKINIKNNSYNSLTKGELHLDKQEFKINKFSGEIIYRDLVVNFGSQSF